MFDDEQARMPEGSEFKTEGAAAMLKPREAKTCDHCSVAALTALSDGHMKINYVHSQSI